MIQSTSLALERPKTKSDHNTSEDSRITTMALAIKQLDLCRVAEFRVAALPKDYLGPERKLFVDSSLSILGTPSP